MPSTSGRWLVKAHGQMSEVSEKLRQLMERLCLHAQSQIYIRARGNTVQSSLGSFSSNCIEPARDEFSSRIYQTVVGQT